MKKIFRGQLFLALISFMGISLMVVSDQSLADDEEFRSHDRFGRNRSIHLSQPGPYAPSCNGNRAFPVPDNRCCEFGPEAFCYTFDLTCPYGQRVVEMDLYCLGYVAHTEAVVVGRMGRRGLQVACEKRDASPGGAQLYGSITCGGRRGFDEYDHHDPFEDPFTVYPSRP